MAHRIIAHFDGDQVRTQVRRNVEWNEYIVEFWYRDNVHTNRFGHRVNADYHTPDKQDALDTAENSAK